MIMKYFILGLISTYQMIPGNFHYCCRHYPTCSDYAIQVIIEYGLIKGVFLSAKRIISCNPFNKKEII